MNRSALGTWGMVMLLVLGAAGVLYFAEWVEKTSNDGYAADAIRNRYLAAERFLDRFDIKIASRDGLNLLDELPPTSHTLLIASSRRSLSVRRVANLNSWVSAGGRLILLASDFRDEDQLSSGDSLLDGLGVKVMEPDADIAQPESAFNALPQQILNILVNQGSCRDETSLARISLAGEEQDITTALGTWSYLAYDGDFEVSYAENDLGPQLLYVEVGAGAVVVLTSLELWSNRQIHCHDHAHLLRWLADDRPVLWWLFNTDMPALPLLIWSSCTSCLTLGALSTGRERPSEPYGWSDGRGGDRVVGRYPGLFTPIVSFFIEQCAVAWQWPCAPGRSVARVKPLTPIEKPGCCRIRWGLVHNREWRRCVGKHAGTRTGGASGPGWLFGCGEQTG